MNKGNKESETPEVGGKREEMLKKKNNVNFSPFLCDGWYNC